MSILRKTLLCTSSILLVSAVTNIEASQAADITQSFNINIDSGPLIGESYSGSYSYDDFGLTGVGEEFADLTAFLFTFVTSDSSTSSVYDLADAQFLGPATADFLDGTFTGITLDIDANGAPFSFASGVFNFEETLDDASFLYDIAGGSGAGDFQLSSTTPIPTPALLPSLIGMGIAEFRRKRNLKKDTEKA